MPNESIPLTGNDPDEQMWALLAPVPWAELATADGQEAVDAAVEARLAVLARSSDREVRKRAFDSLYCSLANQAVAGEVTPAAAGVLVETLRRNLCRERDLVYELLQAIMACQFSNVRDRAEGEVLIVETRRRVVAGLETYLLDVESMAGESCSGLADFLNELVGHYPIVLDRVRAVMEGSDSHHAASLSEVYENLLEHVEEHRRDPLDCFCGVKFWEMLDAAPAPPAPDNHDQGMRSRLVLP